MAVAAVVGCAHEANKTIANTARLAVIGRWNGSGAAPDRSRFIDHCARLTHPPTCARAQINVYIFILLFRYTPTPFGYVQIYTYRSWHGDPRKMGVGMMIEIIRSDAEIGEQIKSRRYTHTRLGTKVCRSSCILMKSRISRSLKCSQIVSQLYLFEYCLWTF